MIRYLFFAAALWMLIILISCNNAPAVQAPAIHDKPVTIKIKDSPEAPVKDSLQNEALIRFAPKGFVIFETIYGDFNNDNLTDCILMIKATDKKNFYNDETRGVLDRNRRGIIALLKEKDNYIPVLKNLACFYSENEDGGNYYPPEIYIEIEKGKLFIHYSHGRYGHWKYTFRYRNRDFDLIGYDLSSNRGPVILREVSINYITGKKIVRDNTNENGESGEEVFEETVTKIKQHALLKLSAIKDFDELDASND